MTTIILVRHGETIWHAENRYTGVSDIALTPLGREQAVGLGRWAAGADLDAIYSSTLTRSIDTARPASEETGLPVTADARLCEVDFGSGEGMTRSEMAERFPEALAAFLATPAQHPLPAGEVGLDAIARAKPALDDIVRAHPDGTALVVMHSTLLRLLIADLIGLDPNAYRRVFPTVGNCALNTLRVGGGKAALLDLNVPASSATRVV